MGKNPASEPRWSDRRAASDATPLRLVGMTYDLAILACRRKDALRSEQAVRLLQEVMRSAGPEDASDLMAFYDWCLDRIRSGEYAIAAQTLSDLRAAWVKAET
jgi:flagellin-specific chaperone FliS